MKLKLIKNLKLKIKNLAFVVSAILVVAIGIGIYSYFFSKPAIASWFDESWLYNDKLLLI